MTLNKSQIPESCLASVSGSTFVNADCFDVFPFIEDKSIDLIIIDPPYNIGICKKWDKWKTNNEYLSFMEKAFKEAERVLKETGSFYFFHNDFIQLVNFQNIISEKTNFHFKQLLVWDKFNGGKSGDKGRLEKGVLNFPKQCEYILFYTKLKGNEPLWNEEVRNYFKNERKKIKKSLTQINKEAFNSKSNKDGMAGNILSTNKKGWSFPTKEKYEMLNKTYPFAFNIDYDKLKDNLVKIKTHTFNCQKRASIIQFPPQQSNEHLTPKPLELIEILIKTSSNENDTVLDFFCGSGTTNLACIKLNRKSIGIEKEKQYYDVAVRRASEYCH